ncbi:hypothetical protein [Siphonobacter curvatus]|uniref:Uncharacterized protein n=1 Tax=Siphonobacter curvatus TaxID=2094562 RepID=A0A2S7IK74_9BACT|nr:hypothetical protein [Siphonobacter curvatus]PQA57002.1 hypothetical protein C5O19_16875 [Siphonobacter curvatus]
METTCLPFASYLEDLIQQRQYVKVQYFSDLHELITLDALFVKLSDPGDGALALLSSGEQIAVSQLASAGGRFAPAYQGYELYCETCDF